MNLDSINKWLTLTANIGVLAGIVFLAAEISLANRLAISSTESGIRDNARNYSRTMVENPELISLLVKMSEDNPELSAEEKELAYHVAMLSFLDWSNIAAQVEGNLLSEYTISANSDDIEVQMNKYPGLVPYWAIIKNDIGLILGQDPIRDRFVIELQERGY